MQRKPLLRTLASFAYRRTVDMTRTLAVEPCLQYQTYSSVGGHACRWDASASLGRQCTVKHEMGLFYDQLIGCAAATPGADCATFGSTLDVPAGISIDWCRSVEELSLCQEAGTCNPKGASINGVCDYDLDGLDEFAVAYLDNAPAVVTSGQCTGNTDATTDVTCTTPATAIANAGAGTTEEECCDTPPPPPPPPPNDSASHAKSSLPLLVLVGVAMVTAVA